MGVIALNCDSEFLTLKTDNSVYRSITALFLGMAIILFIRVFIAGVILVSGESMLPTFKSNEKRVLDKVSLLVGSKPARGDIVAFRVAAAGGNHFVKRVIAVEGDSVAIVNGKVYVNSQLLHEPYVLVDKEIGPDGTDYALRIVPHGHIFVLGDNRNNSVDSRSERIGMVSLSDVIGLVK